MTIVGFLPQRWRPSEEIARHAEAVAGVLHTPPLAQTDSGPTVASLLGTTDVLPYLVAIKSLRGRLGRGRIAIIDDGTLTGEDRAILAHHCADPEILPQQAVRRGPFPAGGAWALLLAILDRRAGRYWIALDAHTVTLGPIPEVEAALASNRSFRLSAANAGIAGFAAGAGGRGLAASVVAEAGQGELITAEAAAEAMLSAEPGAVTLPPTRYAVWRGRPASERVALIHFPSRNRYSGEGYTAVSAAAIAHLAR